MDTSFELDGKSSIVKKLPKELSESTIYHVNQTAKLMIANLDRDMKTLHLNKTQWRIMGYLDMFKTINQSELANLLGLSKAMLGQIIHSFEEKGWVSRKISKTDRRSYDLALTSKAKNTGKLLSTIMVLEAERIMTGFRDEERRELENYLRRMRKNLAEIPETSEVQKLKKELLIELKNLDKD